jgi:hypothetical protein
MIVALLSMSSFAQDICMSGTCPGPTTYEASNLTPGGKFAVLHGSGLGAAALAGGPCPGLVTGMTGVTVLGTGKADRNGYGFSSVIPAACGGYVQAMDVTTCTLSPAVSAGIPSCLAVKTAAVGSFVISAGPPWSAAGTKAMSCLDTCARLNGGVASDYQCSSVAGAVDGKSFVDGWGDSQYCATAVPEGFKKGGSTNCGSVGCYYSAYVADHGCASTNYCWTR